jgi:hypothetical protein
MSNLPVLNLSISSRARAELRRWLESSGLEEPIPGLLFGGAPGGPHTWSIGMYRRNQISEIEKMTLQNGHSAHFNANGVELLFWQYFLREQIEGKTLDYDERRRFFVE